VIALREDVATVTTLVRRDLALFVRQRSRLIGAIAQPLLLWLAVGAGIAPAFRLGGGDVGYMQYFYPGIVLMLLLQNAISATMSVIEDRHQGFLQGVLVAPGSRAAVVVGKCLGASLVSCVQAALFLALAPLAGFSYSAVHWPAAAAVVFVTAMGFTGLGFAIAWWLDSTTGYHVVMSLVLFPAWILSGAMFPPAGVHAVLAWIVRLNPMTYAVLGLRRAMHGGALPAGTGPAASSFATEFAAVAVAAVVLVALAVWAVRRRPAAA